MRYNKTLYITLLGLFFGLSSLVAQNTSEYTEMDLDYKKGLELFDKEKYGAAQERFQRVIANYGNTDVEYRANAEFYSAICAIELFNEDAEFLISDFISKYPESSKVNTAYFNMARFQYRQKEYYKALDWFGRVNKDKLKEEEIHELYFKQGYAHFQNGKLDKAGNNFYEIKDRDTKYTGPALYYYSHIAYYQENYETALEGFERLSSDETFAPVVPYYISHIYYFQQKFDKVIEYATPLVESASEKRKPELAKIVGDSYYRKKNYEKAIEYFEIHKQNAARVEREDYYQLGYAYHHFENYDSAIVNFEKVADARDKLSQNTYFHLADCYLNKDEKNKARLAFEFASKRNFDPEIREEALYNYALLTYELYHSPFNEAIETFHQFVEEYPNSHRLDEAYNFLVMAYMYTSNYKEALKSLDRIQEKDHTIKEAYQKVAYFRALELYNNLRYAEAIETFTKSLKYFQYNKKIAGQSHYWRAEAYYQLKNYEEAVDGYKEFLVTGGAFQMPIYDLAHYNLGYAYFKLKDYDEAIQWYRKYIGFADEESDVLSDTYNRIGDCYFKMKSYWVATEYYDKAIELGLMDVDYALFQRGFALGLVERPLKKINSMQKLVDEHPGSAYLDDALYEMGKSYIDMQDEENALIYYKRVVGEFPTSSYVKKSLVQLGLINYNHDNNEEALKHYKRVVAEFPGTPESKNALTGIKNIYVDKNDVDTYFSYVNSLGDFANVSVSEQDSLTYISAENLYMKGDCNKAVLQFNNYLTRFTDGNFILNAHFYLADCYTKMGEDQKAIESYDFVTEKPKNTFSEQALVAAAVVKFKNEDFEGSLENYKKLELVAEVNYHLIDARVGQMRCHYLLMNDSGTIEACDKVLHTDKIGEELKREAHYKKATALYESKNFEKAIDEYRIIASDVNSDEGAEASFRIAEIFFMDKKVDKTEKEIFDFVQKNTSQEYWLARSFILLSDVYLAQKDAFQAKHTLQSIIDNYDQDAGDDVLAIAQEKLDKIVEEEKANEKEAEEMTIEFEESKEGEIEELFEEEEVEIIPDTTNIQNQQ